VPSVAERVRVTKLSPRGGTRANISRRRPVRDWEERVIVEADRDERPPREHQHALVDGSTPAARNWPALPHGDRRRSGWRAAQALGSAHGHRTQPRNPAAARRAGRLARARRAVDRPGPRGRARSRLDERHLPERRTPRKEARAE